MGGDRFWYFFGGIWLIVGLCFIAASLGVNLFADPAFLEQGVPPWLFLLLGILMAGAGAAIIYFARAAAMRDQRLMQAGIPLTATVVDIERSWIEVNRQTRWHVVYRYQDPGGRALRGKSRAMPGEAVWGLKPGDKVSIKIDPQRPEESLFLGTA